MALSRRLNRPAAVSMLCCSRTSLRCSSARRSSWAPERLLGLGEHVAGGLQAGQHLIDVLRHHTEVGPQRGKLGDRLDLGGERTEGFLERLRPGWRLLPRLGQLPQQSLGLRRELAGQVGQLVPPDLLDQPLQPFQVLADLLQGARVRPLIRDVILDRAGEQLAHAVGGAGLAAAKHDVVSRLIHGGAP